MNTMTNPVDTLKALRGGMTVTADDARRAYNAAIAALSESSHISTVMRIEHEGRTFSVDGWAGPMVKWWREVAMAGGEAVAWLHQVVGDDGEPDQALSFSPDNFPLEGVAGYRSLSHQPLYTTPRIDAMVARFLAWRLPDDFAPDDGISFDPIANRGTQWEAKRTPTGTNLLTAEQARAMFEHCLTATPGGATTGQVPEHFDRERFRKAPCYLCGYSGEGYYQSATHPCAARFHAAAPREE